MAFPSVGPKVEPHAALVPIDREEVRRRPRPVGGGADPWRAPAARPIALGRLDLDDIGAQVAEQHGAVGPGQHGRAIDDPEAGQRSWRRPLRPVVSGRAPDHASNSACSSRSNRRAGSSTRSISASMCVLHTAKARSCSGSAYAVKPPAPVCPKRRRADARLDGRLVAEEVAHRLRPGGLDDDVLRIGLEGGRDRDALARQEPSPIDAVANERRVQASERACVGDPACRRHDRPRELRDGWQASPSGASEGGTARTGVVGRRQAAADRPAGPGSNSSRARRGAADSGIPNQSEFDPEWSAHVVGQDPFDRPPIDPADELADEPAERESVVAGLRARLPGGRRVLEDRAHAVPVDDILGAQVDRQVGQPGHVTQRMAGGDPLLAMFCEGRPDIGDRGVVVELASLREEVGDGRGDTLRHREGHEDGVTVDGAPGRGIRDARPGIDHELPAMVRGDLEADLRAGRDDLVEQCLDARSDVVCHAARLPERPGSRRPAMRRCAALASRP